MPPDLQRSRLTVGHSSRLLIVKTAYLKQGIFGMNGLIAFFITAVVTAISLLVVSRIPFLGVEVDDFWKAIVAGVIFGILNAFLKPVLFWLTIPFTVVTLGLFLFILNAIIFALVAWLVDGFRLRNGFLSAIFGAIALSIVNAIVIFLLRAIGLVV
ncbi:MAG: phage holin family protein [Kovacikia sp.]